MGKGTVPCASLEDFIPFASRKKIWTQTSNSVLQKLSNKSRQTSIPNQKMSLRKLPSSVQSGENSKYAMMDFQERPSQTTDNHENYDWDKKCDDVIPE